MRKITYIGVACLVAATLGAWLWVDAQRYSSERIIAECDEVGNTALCYTDRLTEVLDQRGIPAAFDVLADIYNADQNFAGTCHAETHEIGKTAYALFQKTGHIDLSPNAHYCGYGFYHGFMEALFADTNDLQEARDFCSFVGRSVSHPPPPEFAEGSCYHGIGHGVTDGTDPRVWGDPIALVKPGLALCAKVTQGNESWHRRCASGVFNALGNMYPDPKYKLDAGTNPYTLCNDESFNPIEKEMCYNQMNTQAAALAGNDLRTIVAFSNPIRDVRYRSSALHEAVSFYIQVLKRKHTTLPPEDVAVCLLPIFSLRESCVSGFVGGIFEFGSPGQQYKEVLQLCGAEKFPEDLSGLCYESLLKHAGFYNDKRTIERICEAVPLQYHTSICTL